MAHSQVSTVSEKNPLRVLVVDDCDDEHTVAASSLLAARGHEVEFSRGWDATISRANLFSPDLVLLDLAMPAMDGIKIGHEIRNLALPREPALAAYADVSTLKVRQECARAGFDHFLSKPAGESELDQLTRLVRVAAGRASEFEAKAIRFQEQAYRFTVGQLQFCRLVLESLPYQTDADKRRRQVARLYRTITLSENWLVKQTGMPLEDTVEMEQDITELRNWLAASEPIQP